MSTSKPVILDELYDFVFRANDYLLGGGLLDKRQKKIITERILAKVSDRSEAERFWQGLNFSDNTDSAGRRMYPVYFIPPRNSGKKHKIYTGMTPGTHILSANAYELEILRLLHLMSPGDELVRNMVNETLKRLKTTCFANEQDGMGECFEASLIALRFLAVVSPDDSNWIKARLRVFKTHFSDKKRHSGVKMYFFLCLSELPDKYAVDEIQKYKDEFLKYLERNHAVKGDSTLQKRLIYITKNCLARLPE